MPTTQQQSLFINGEFTKNTSTNYIPVYDPSTEEVIAETRNLLDSLESTT